MYKIANQVVRKHIDDQRKAGFKVSKIVADLGFTYQRMYWLMSKGATPTNREQKMLKEKFPDLTRDDMLGPL